MVASTNCNTSFLGDQTEWYNHIDKNAIHVGVHTRVPLTAVYVTFT